MYRGGGPMGTGIDGDRMCRIIEKAKSKLSSRTGFSNSMQHGAIF